MHRLNEQRRVRTFYDLLQKGEISVVAEEQTRYQAHKNGLFWVQSLEILPSLPSPTPKPSAVCNCIDLRPNFSPIGLFRFTFRGIGSCNTSQMGGKIAGAGAVQSFCIGMGIFMFSQSFWILYDWNEERKVRKLYDGLLEKGEIYQDLLRKGLVSVVAEDE